MWNVWREETKQINFVRNLLDLVPLLFRKCSSSFWWPVHCTWHFLKFQKSSLVNWSTVQHNWISKVLFLKFCHVFHGHLYVSFPSQSAGLLPTKATISASFHFICKSKIKLFDHIIDVFDVVCLIFVASGRGWMVVHVQHHCFTPDFVLKCLATLHQTVVTNTIYRSMIHVPKLKLQPSWWTIPWHTCWNE